MPYLEEDGSILYKQCADLTCPAHREGFHHAHAVEVVAADGTVTPVDTPERPASGGGDQ